MAHGHKVTEREPVPSCSLGLRPLGFLSGCCLPLKINLVCRVSPFRSHCSLHQGLKADPLGDLAGPSGAPALSSCSSAADRHGCPPATVFWVSKGRYSIPGRHPENCGPGSQDCLLGVPNGGVWEAQPAALAQPTSTRSSLSFHCSSPLPRCVLPAPCQDPPCDAAGAANSGWGNFWRFEPGEGREPFPPG